MTKGTKLQLQFQRYGIIHLQMELKLSMRLWLIVLSRTPLQPLTSSIPPNTPPTRPSAKQIPPTIGGSKGVLETPRPLPRSNFFYFHTVSKVKDCVPLPLREIFDPPLRTLIILR